MSFVLRPKQDILPADACISLRVHLMWSCRETSERNKPESPAVQMQHNKAGPLHMGRTSLSLAWQVTPILCIPPTPQLSMPTAVPPILFFSSIAALASFFVSFYRMIENKTGEISRCHLARSVVRWFSHKLFPDKYVSSLFLKPSKDATDFRVSWDNLSYALALLLLPDLLPVWWVTSSLLNSLTSSPVHYGHRQITHSLLVAAFYAFEDLEHVFHILKIFLISLILYIALAFVGIVLIWSKSSSKYGAQNWHVALEMKWHQAMWKDHLTSPEMVSCTHQSVWWVSCRIMLFLFCL